MLMQLQQNSAGLRKLALHAARDVVCLVHTGV